MPVQEGCVHSIKSGAKLRQMIRVGAFTAFFFVCTVSLAAQQKYESVEDTCGPSGSAGCVGAEYSAQRSQTNKEINASYRRVLNLLPKVHVEHLPTREDFMQLHVSRSAYVKSYCNSYWHFWNGAPPWKSAESVNCEVKFNEQYINFLNTLGECAKSDEYSEACQKLMGTCTPTSC